MNITDFFQAREHFSDQVYYEKNEESKQNYQVKEVKHMVYVDEAYAPIEIN